MYRLFITILFLSVSFCAGAQRITAEQYVEQYKDLAIREMKRMGVPAAITLAQGLLETESGNSDLVKRSSNHFGIKCKDSWTGARVYHDDDAAGECFRAYDSAEDSYRDHSNYLRGSKRYETLFGLEATDYKGWAYGLKRAGYATNPRYPDILIKNIEQYNLQQYTLAGITEIPEFDASKYTDDTVKKNPKEIKEEKTNDAVANTVDVPDKIININKTACVFVKKGVSLLLVAAKNNINLNKLLEFNELAEDGILGKGQYIYLHKKLKTGEKEFYIVQAGESIYDVAQKNGIQLRYLRGYNHLTDGETVAAGTKLFLQPRFKAAGINTIQEKNKTHFVAPKEGLYTIARKYNVSVQQLK